MMVVYVADYGMSGEMIMVELLRLRVSELSAGLRFEYRLPVSTALSARP